MGLGVSGRCLGISKKAVKGLIDDQVTKQVHA